MLPLAPLSPQQRAAVERTGQDVCVVAGPGSGKTRVLIERFAWLVEAQGVDPARILAITFTEKAATEIKQRLIAKFADKPERREALEHVWVSTIDGFCARLLSEHSVAAGLAPDFTILEAGAADHMLRLAAEDALDELYREQPEMMRRLFDALDLTTQDDTRQPDLAESLIQIYQTMRISAKDELPATASAPSMLEAAQDLASVILRDATAGNTSNTKLAIEKLNEWARQFGALPRSPIEQHHLALATLAGVNTGHIGRTSRHDAARRLKNELLPDLQAAWLGALYHGLHDLLRTAVDRIASAYAAAKRAESAVDFADLEAFAIRLLETDDDIRAGVQQMFDFTLMDELQDTNFLQWRLVTLVTPLDRGAFFGVGDPNQSIFGFRYADPEFFEAYRTHVAERGGVIDTLRENHRSHPEILAAVSRTLHGAPGIEPRPLTASRRSEGREVERLVGEDEAEFVASRICQLVASESRPFNQIAVLVRSLTSLDPFARAFDRFNIPFVVSGGRTFLEARETRDLVGLLAALANPLDEIATVGVLRGPLGQISDEEIFRMGPEGRQQVFEERFGALRRMAGFVPPDLLLARALDSCSYTAPLSERALANVDKFLGWVRREHRRRTRPLPELLDALEALRDAQSEAEAPPPEAADAVRVMTIHAAKGLEFPVVFVVALHRKPDVSQPPILFSSELGLGAKWRNPVSGKGQSDTVHKKLVAERKLREEAEENRLLYVAMTRAEDRLILSYTERKYPSPWQKLIEHLPQLPDVGQRHALSSREKGSAWRCPTEPLELAVGQYDSSASVTDVAEFAACPRRYYLGRYLGLNPEPQGHGTGAIQTGLAVHRALAGERVDSPEANQLADRFRASDLGTRAALAARIEREFDFMLPIEDVIVSGQIDLWFEEGGELVLVDYKTDVSTASDPQPYAIQLQLYAVALERYAGRLPDRAVLAYLRQDQQVEVPLSALDLEAARDAVRNLRYAQDSLVFPVNPGERCKRCPFYQGACPVATFP